MFVYLYEIDRFVYNFCLYSEVDVEIIKSGQ